MLQYIFFHTHQKRGLKLKFPMQWRLLIHGFDTIYANRFMEIEIYLFNGRYCETPLPPNLHLH